MANLSDAYGTYTITAVGNEFLEFLREVQGSEEQAYYKLVEINDFKDLVPDSEGDLDFDFSTYGRWSYSGNLEGYLEGTWSNWTDDSVERKAYNKFLKALKKKSGVVEVEYKDSDDAMLWKGNGVYVVKYEGDELVIDSNFEEEE